ncbi:hypothetical protein JOF48_002513 [Arthrobacter stackebrandtii]|uniref:Uncharacterized protein n=1 Tax=Arthrobacter stackebrandtii TaxID=272161 RepID=A0ABS4YYC0_9MICC|nr:Rv3235 family protein [Arthrobacter stackebrandtii]MBP2413714.1 hypothetical protein [Arthrobacter stackebrandtii]PYH00011.1 hypothetical protein CVV67_12605 [Arthrobacter stackebrandtii]
MSTPATSDGTAPTLLVVRPVTPPDFGEAAGGNVVRLRPPGLHVRQTGVGRAEEENAAQPRNRARKRAAGKVSSLDPSSADREVVEMMASKVAQAVLEALSGARSVQQLARWLDGRCIAALTTRARLYAEACKAELRHRSSETGTVVTLHHQPRVHSIHCCAVAPGIYEASVVMADANRFRALAMRLELHTGLWKVTALNVG